MSFLKCVMLSGFTLLLLSTYSYALNDKVNTKQSSKIENNITHLTDADDIEQNIDLKDRAKDRVAYLIKDLSLNLYRTSNLYEYFSSLIQECIALEYTTAWVLGSHYKKLSEQQRLKYTELGRDLLIFAYGNMLAYYYKQYDFEIQNVTKRSARNYEVSVLITSKANTNYSNNKSSTMSIPTVWVLSYSNQQNRFYILDIVINNISLLQVQRASFSDQINNINGDYNLFLQQLSRKVAGLKVKGFSR